MIVMVSCIANGDNLELGSYAEVFVEGRTRGSSGSTTSLALSGTDPLLPGPGPPSSRQYTSSKQTFNLRIVKARKNSSGGKLKLIPIEAEYIEFTQSTANVLHVTDWIKYPEDATQTKP